MMWDPGFRAWNHYDMRSPSDAILLDRSGNVIERYRVGFRLNDVLNRI